MKVLACQTYDMAGQNSFPSDARPLQALLQPSSIAVVGASADPRSFGGFVLGNLRRFGYAGALHLVSRSSDDIDGLRCVRTVAELPDALDLAVLAIPERAVTTRRMSPRSPVRARQAW